ncbi:MAG: VWA domain-containing protein [Planctomycetes bacterium]|nr:VWA domain-containing protein [Planctomycetota bacterium]
MNIDFEYPLFLLLIPIGAAYFYFVARSTLAGLYGIRKKLAFALRMLVLSALAIALASPTIPVDDGSFRVIFLLDASKSIPESAQNEAMEFIRDRAVGRGVDDEVAFYAFARDTSIQVPFTKDFIPDNRISGDLKRDRTDISAALDISASTFPSGARRKIVLITDGNENIGDAVEAVTKAKQQGILVDVYPLSYAYSRDVSVERISVPESVIADEGFSIEVVVSSDVETDAIFEIHRNGELLTTSSAPIRLKPGTNSLAFQDVIPPPGPDDPLDYRYEVVARIADREADGITANNRAEGFTSLSSDVPRILCVERANSIIEVAHASIRTASGDLVRREYDHGESTGALVKAMTEDQRQMRVSVIRSPTFPSRMEDLAAYDLLILGNVPVNELSPTKLTMIQVAVRDTGMGLIVLGGDSSFAAGGYNDSTLEEVLPVNMEPKQGRELEQGAIVMILHTCEIGGEEDWGKRVARETLKVLSPQDEVGVVFFDWTGGAKWLFGLQPAGGQTNRILLASKINEMQNGDMPDFAPCVELAYEGLEASDASKKLIILISDGDPAPPGNKILNNITESSIAFSTVHIGSHGQDCVQTMMNMATSAEHYFQVTDPTKLPAIFIQEAQQVTRNTVVTDPFVPLISEITTPIESSIPNSNVVLPQLGGYVITSEKRVERGQPPPMVPLRVPNEFEDPLLAHWDYGLGRSVAFTSDARDDLWAKDWHTSWGEFNSFWLRIVNWTLRRVKKSGFTTQINPGPEGAHVVVQAVNETGEFIEGIPWRGTVVDPNGDEHEVELEQTGAGLYEGEFRTTEEGTYFFSASFKKADGESQGAGMVHQGFNIAYSPEFRRREADMAKIRDMVKASGGRLLSKEDNVFTGTLDTMKIPDEYWYPFVVAGLLLFLFDVLVRRVDLGLNKLTAKMEERRKEKKKQLDELRKRAVASTASVTLDLNASRKSSAQLSAESEKPAPAATATAEKAPEEEGYMQALLDAKKRVKKQRDWRKMED